MSPEQSLRNIPYAVEESHRAINNGDECEGNARGNRIRPAQPVQNHIRIQSESNVAYAVLENIAQGDYAAFWDLWLEYEKYLFGVCLRQMGGKHADAEDALSRAMLIAMDRLPRHARSIINPRAWLTRLTYNVCIDVHRENYRRNESFDSDSFTTVGSEHAILLSGSPEDRFLRDELCAFLAQKIDQLPVRLREPFVLRFGHELAYQDVADQLRISAENVRKRIQHARAILRAELNKYFQSLFATPIDEPKGKPDKLPETSSAKIRPKPLGPRPVDSGSRSVAYFDAGHEIKPTRHQAKLNSLEKYIESHPRGWKKRLEIARLLCAIGNWNMAIRNYLDVLKKQPQLTEVWIELGTVLVISERNVEAAEAFQSATRTLRTGSE